MTAPKERFMLAGVPRSCWALSCRERGQPQIPAWAIEQKDKSTKREALLSAYVQLPPSGRRATDAGEEFAYHQETVELLARHAVLEGLSVKLLPFHALVHTLEHPEIYRGQDIDPETRPRLTVFDILGSGVIVVPLLPAPEDADCTPAQYRVAVDFLLTHIYEGGALVIGGQEQLSKRLQSHYPKSLERMLLGNSEFFGISK